MHSPQKIVVQLFRCRLLERRYLAALRIHAGKDVADGAVLAAGIQSLKHHQQSVALVGVQHVLQLAQFFDVGLNVGLGLADSERVGGIAFAEVRPFARLYQELLREFHCLVLSQPSP